MASRIYFEPLERINAKNSLRSRAGRIGIGDENSDINEHIHLMTFASQPTEVNTEA